MWVCSSWSGWANLHWYWHTKAFFPTFRPGAHQGGLSRMTHDGLAKKVPIICKWGCLHNRSCTVAGAISFIRRCSWLRASTQMALLSRTSIARIFPSHVSCIAPVCARPYSSLLISAFVSAKYIFVPISGFWYQIPSNHIESYWMAFLNCINTIA